MKIIFSFIVTFICAWCFSQLFKTLLSFCITKKVNVKMMLSDGDFPSTHTTVAVAAVIAICYQLWPVVVHGTEYQQVISAMVIILTVLWASFIIRDALGIRLRVQNLSKTVYSFLTQSGGIEPANSLITANLQDFWNELAKSINLKAGHMPHEVIGGAILGAIFGIGNCAYSSNNVVLLYVDIVIFIVYSITTLLVIGRKHD